MVGCWLSNAQFLGLIHCTVKREETGEQQGEQEEERQEGKMGEWEEKTEAKRGNERRDQRAKPGESGELYLPLLHVAYLTLLSHTAVLWGSQTLMARPEALCGISIWLTSDLPWFTHQTGWHRL